MASDSTGETKWKELSIRCWDDFDSEVKELNAKGLHREYLFRGHSDAKWFLRPSFCRLTTQKDPTTALSIERAALDEFSGNAHRYLDLREFAGLEVFPTNTVEPKWNIDVINWWMLMQQYGAPTRLLDWSNSPYVALYFAVNDNPGKDAAVWFFNQNVFNDAVKAIYGDKSDLPRLLDEAVAPISIPDTPRMLLARLASHHTERTFKQQDIFTMCSNVFADHENVIASYQRQTDLSIGLTKLIINAADKPLFLRKLWNMNITGASLYTGIQALATHTSDIVMQLLGFDNISSASKTG